MPGHRSAFSPAFTKTIHVKFLLTYIIFVHRVWEACHLNKGTDLRKSRTRTMKQRYLTEIWVRIYTANFSLKTYAKFG